MMQSVFSALLVLGTVASCSDPLGLGETPPLDERPVTVRAAIGDTFRIRQGEVAEIGDDGLRVAFLGVVQDSRCPQGVECAWAGDAVVKLEISAISGSTFTTELHTGGLPKRARVGSYLIELLDLEPYPVGGTGIDPDEYVAVLRVTEA